MGIVNPKPGYKTTEFWLTIFAIAAPTIEAIAGNLPAQWAAIASGVATGMYAFSRGLAKSREPPTT
jgi:hypothetical protein